MTSQLICAIFESNFKPFDKQTFGYNLDTNTSNSNKIQSKGCIQMADKPRTDRTITCRTISYSKRYEVFLFESLTLKNVGFVDRV